MVNAIDLLIQQHEEVKKLFTQYEQLSERASVSRQKLFAQIADALAAHATIEELYFYPAVKAAETEDLLLEAAEEHLGVKRILADLVDMDVSDDTFDAKMKVIQENVEHHIGEEEEELFKMARKLLSKEQLMDLGVQMMEEYETLMEREPRNEVPLQTDEAAPI
jgi:hemerythrin-like domain-containing protein